jgi:hypothetical protein
MADLEFAVVTKQCLDQRLPDQTTVRQQLGAWETRRNAAQATVNWQLTTAKARHKLKKLYPAESIWSTTSTTVVNSCNLLIFRWEEFVQVQCKSLNLRCPRRHVKLSTTVVLGHRASISLRRSTGAVIW